MVNVVYTNNGTSFCSVDASTTYMTDAINLKQAYTDALSFSPGGFMTFSQENVSPGIQLQSPIIKMPMQVLDNTFNFEVPAGGFLPYFGYIGLFNKTYSSYSQYACIGYCRPVISSGEFYDFTPKVVLNGGEWLDISIYQTNTNYEVIKCGGFVPQFISSTVDTGVLDMYIYNPVLQTYKLVSIVVGTNGLVVAGSNNSSNPDFSQPSSSTNFLRFVPYGYDKDIISKLLSNTQSGGTEDVTVDSSKYVSI